MAAYHEQARGLLDGGVDLLLVETVFDTLNAKAALFAIDRLFEEGGRRVPVMVSVTIVDQSGRTLSGQTVEAFWNSVSHAGLLSVGINCALGAKQMRPFVEELSRDRARLRQLLPERRPAQRLRRLRRDAGDHGRGPARLRGQRLAQHRGRLLRHDARRTSAAIAEAVRGPEAARVPPRPSPTPRLSGLEPLTIRPDTNFVNVGERTNVTGSPAVRAS